MGYELLQTKGTRKVMKVRWNAITHGCEESWSGGAQDHVVSWLVLSDHECLCALRNASGKALPQPRDLSLRRVVAMRVSLSGKSAYTSGERTGMARSRCDV